MPRKKAAQRKPFWERSLEHFLNIFKQMLIPALAIWLIGWLWLGGVFQSTQNIMWDGFVNWTANQGFVVNDVIIEGRHKTDLTDIQSALNIKKNDPLLAIDIDDIQRKTNDMDWVKRASITRHYNGVIIVELVERIPFVIWRRPGRSDVVIDMDGDIIDAASPKNYQNLLMMRGVNAQNHIVPLLEMIMAQPDVKPFITGVEWIGDRRWDVITNTKTRIHLPQKDVGYALARLSKMHIDTNILNQGYQSIDLRAPDRVIVETPRGKTQEIMNLSSATKANII
jgi:cell division protein FtsQ